MTHVWFWRPRMGEKNRKGMACRVLVRGGMSGALVQLEDGELVVCSRYAIRKEVDSTKGVITDARDDR